MNGKAGLIICAFLGALDVVGITGLGEHPGPPAGVAIAGAILGIATLAAVRAAGQGQARAVRAVIGTRVASVLIGLPVFFTDDAPNWARGVVAFAIAATAVGVSMLVPAARRGSARRPQRV